MILNNILVEQLSELGLSKKEAILYLALLELGPSSVQELAKTTKLNRSGIYSCLESLIKEDFSYMQEKDDTRIYTAKSPEVLMKKAELLAKTFSKTSRESLSLLTDLNGLAPRFKPEPRVLFSEGRAGLNTIKNTVFSLPRQTQIKAFLHSVSSNEIGSSQ
jgi:sugar-specific transcriptional regulator TrmB